jgi:uncharacterized membrane protein
MMPETDMAHGTASPPSWTGIMRRAREHDSARVQMHGRARASGSRALQFVAAHVRVPALLPEYLKGLLGSVIGFWLLAWPLAAFADVSRLSTYAVLGLVFSLQATHHKYRLARDPGYKVRRCNCAGTRRDGTEVVLRSSASAIGGVPLSLLGVAANAAIMVLLIAGHAGAALVLGAVGLVVSVYLAFVMITRVRALCATCMNIAALNILLVVQLMRGQ